MVTHRPAWVLACLAIVLVAATGARADQLDLAPYQLAPHPRTLFNMAVCQEELGQHGLA